MQKRQTLILLLLLALLAPALVLTLPARAATGKVEPAVGPPGTTFTFFAEGFEPFERIGVWVQRPDGTTFRLGSEVEDTRKVADEQGTLTWSWESSEFAQAGRWVMIAQGQDSTDPETERRPVATILFTITGDQEAETTSWFVDPPSGTPGTTFTFVGRSTGFIPGDDFEDPGEQVGSWFIRPDGQTVDVFEGLSVDPDGQIYRVWQAPADAMGGEWVFRVVGISSGFQMDMYFTIDGPTAPPGAQEPAPPREVAPPNGPPGTVFSFTVGGFTSGELVDNWLIAPGGALVEASPWLQADDAGIARWEWPSPPDSALGTWTWVVDGTQTALETGITFEVGGAAPPPGPPADQPASPGPGIAPSVGVPGGTFTVTVEDFRPNDVIYYWVESPSGAIIEADEEIRADDAGRAVWDWQAPTNAEGGEWLMIVRGLGQDERLRLPFRIEAPAQPAAELGVTPASGSPGTLFQFFATGFEPFEEIDTWAFWEPDEYTTYHVEQEVEADADGRAAWEWMAPADAPGGQWNMVARGYQERKLHIIAFTIDGPVPTQQARAGVTPETGPPGTTFTFFGEGFNSDNLVTYWLTDPDGRTVRVGDGSDGKEADEAHVDDNGRVEITWVSPADAKRGFWIMTMTATKTDSAQEIVDHIILFTIE